MTPVLPPYDGPASAVPQVTPLTYRDGVTMLKKVDSIAKYINLVIVPFVNENYAGLAEAFETQVNILITQVNEALAAQDASLDLKIAELEDYVDAALVSMGVSVSAAEAAQAAAEAAAAEAALYADEAGDVTSTAMTAVWNNVASTFRVALDNAYANKATQTTVETGRLSAANMALKANTADVNAALANKADISTQVTVETGRLSVATLNSRFSDMNKTALAAQVGGYVYIGDQFNKLRTGLINTAANTRVIVVGDSHAGDGVGPNLSVVPRLAFRCGATSVGTLSAVGGAVGTTGMLWYNGSSGGAGSSNYLNATSMTKIGYVQPDYVIHIIGANNYNGQTPIADFKNDLRGWAGQIEATTPAINVFVHSHGSPGVASPTITWEQYGTAMAEVVAELPSKRVYIDADDVFKTMGIRGNTANRFDLKIGTPDLVHLNGHGSRLFADIIGAYMGIPSETDLGSIPRIAAFPTFVGTAINAYSVISEITIPAANYTRSVDIFGKLYAAFSNANDEIHIRQMEGASLIERRRYRATRTSSVDMVFNANFTQLPFKTNTYQVFAAPNTENAGQPITPVNDPTYSFASATVNAL